VTVVVSLCTKPRPDAELVGLVHSLTPKPESAHINLVEAARGVGRCNL
jgi:solute:Na+ symporter, SSS family